MPGRPETGIGTSENDSPMEAAEAESGEAIVSGAVPDAGEIIDSAVFSGRKLDLDIRNLPFWSLFQTRSRSCAPGVPLCLDMQDSGNTREK